MKSETGPPTCLVKLCKQFFHSFIILSYFVNNVFNSKLQTSNSKLQTFLKDEHTIPITEKAIIFSDGFTVAIQH